MNEYDDHKIRDVFTIRYQQSAQCRVDGREWRWRLRWRSMAITLFFWLDNIFRWMILRKQKQLKHVKHPRPPTVRACPIITYDDNIKIHSS